MIVNNFQTKNGPLLEQSLNQPGINWHGDDPRKAEYAVGVDWLKAVPIAEAKRFDGIFANQNIVCKLRDPKTIDFLREQLGVSTD